MTGLMLDQGIKGMSGEEISEKLDFYGASTNFQMSMNYNNLSIVTLTKYSKETLSLLRRMITDATFPESKIEVLRQKLISSYLLRERKTKDISSKALVESLYGKGHVYARFVNEESYKFIRREHLVDFYRAHFNSRNITLFLSGEVTDETIGVVEQLFGNEEFGESCEAKALDVNPVMGSVGEKVFKEMDFAQQNTLRLGRVTIQPIHTDYVKYHIMTTLFGGYFGSRLSRNIREDKGYTYGIGIQHVPYPSNSYMQIVCETASEYVNAVKHEVYNEIARMVNEKVSPDELEVVKNYMYGDVIRSYEDSMSLSLGYMSLYCLGLPFSQVESMVETIRQVTPDDILSMAQKYLPLEGWNEVVAGKKY